MKEKGFTLIELLAVIVILAIIALIATPIILNIIDDSKNSSDKRSIELYAKAIENAVGNYQLKNAQDKDITLEKISEYIEYKGNKVECEITEIYEDGTIYLDKCKIDNKEVEYTYGKYIEVTDSQICKLEEGTSKTIGAKYTCTLDEERTFYVLENDESLDYIVLLMDRNYTDADVPSKMIWGEEFHHTVLDTYIEKIQVKFGNKVTVGIPSYNQMTGIGCAKEYSSCPTWAYDYLHGTSNPVSNIYGYWTSEFSIYADGHYAWSVNNSGSYNDTYSIDNESGLRPVINISRTLLN